MARRAETAARILLFGVLTASGPAWARVNVDVHVGVPVAPVPVAPVPVPVPVPVAPAVVVPAYPPPPSLVLVPNTSVYFVPEVSGDLFVCNDVWWTSRGGRWYRARSHGGPWRSVSHHVVPAPILHLPANYRAAYGHREHIPYGQWKKHRGEWKHKEKWKEEAHEGGRHGHGKWRD